jgi:hypothetical protein
LLWLAVGFAIPVLLLENPVGVAAAAKQSLEQQAWAKCRAKYNKSLFRVEVLRGGARFVCHYYKTGGAPVTEEQAREQCRTQYPHGGSVIPVFRNGKWWCKWWE